MTFSHTLYTEGSSLYISSSTGGGFIPSFAWAAGDARRLPDAGDREADDGVATALCGRDELEPCILRFLALLSDKLGRVAGDADAIVGLCCQRGLHWMHQCNSLYLTFPPAFGSFHVIESLETLTTPLTRRGAQAGGDPKQWGAAAVEEKVSGRRSSVNSVSC